MSDEEIPDWIAQLDQLLRGVADFAKVTYGYYVALVEQGFSEQQAFALTLAFQAGIQGSS
jgi:hypothetical protein